MGGGRGRPVGGGAVADPGVCDRDDPTPLNLSQYWKPMESVRDRDRSPPLECGWRHTGTVQGGGGGACECPRVGVFFNFPEGGWRHADNVQGGCVLVNVFTPPPFRKSCVRAWGPWGRGDVPPTLLRVGGGKDMFVPPPLSDPEFRPRHRAYWYLWRHFGVACITVLGPS